MYTGPCVPSVDLLDHTAINQINRFFQLHTNTTPLVGNKVLELYQPLSNKEVEQGFCSTYKKIYTLREAPFFQLAWASFCITKGTHPEQNQQMQQFGISIISSDPIKYSRRLY